MARPRVGGPLKMSKGQIQFYLRQREHPGATAAQVRTFLDYATPEQRQRAGLPQPQGSQR
jgi:hypothetical protein